MLRLTASDSALQAYDDVTITVYPEGGGGLPAPWLHNDIGDVGAAGDANYADGVFTVDGSGYDIHDVDYIVPHQANGRIIQAMAKKLGVSMDKVVMTIEHYGNISSATVPIALDVAVRDERIQRGSLVLLTAFGGGLTWGSSLIRW